MCAETSCSKNRNDKQQHQGWTQPPSCSHKAADGHGCGGSSRPKATRSHAWPTLPSCLLPPCSEPGWTLHSTGLYLS